MCSTWASEVGCLLEESSSAFLKDSPNSADASMESAAIGRNSLKSLDHVPPKAGSSLQSSATSLDPNCGDCGNSGLLAAALDALVAPSAASALDRESLLASMLPAKPNEEERPKGRRFGDSADTSLDRDR
jgi:hypothetical protein